MKKLMNLCKWFFPEGRFVVLLLLIVDIMCLVIYGFTFLGVVGALILIGILVSSIKTEKPQGPFCVAVDDNADEIDPIPEPAEKLPYVYYDQPEEQVAHRIYYYSSYLGKTVSIAFRARKQRGKPFDNVRGIQVADDLVLLRSILFTSNFPDDIREMAKQHEGRFPNEAEIEQIYTKFNEINQNLYECGEPLLKRRKYLYTSGDENADKVMNYCLNFANGEKALADCDSCVCAVLVEKTRKHFLQNELGG